MPETPPHLHEPVQGKERRYDADGAEGKRKDRQNVYQGTSAGVGGVSGHYLRQHLGDGGSMKKLGKRDPLRTPEEVQHGKEEMPDAETSSPAYDEKSRPEMYRSMLRDWVTSFRSCWSGGTKTGKGDGSPAQRGVD